MRACTDDEIALTRCDLCDLRQEPGLTNARLAPHVHPVRALRRRVTGFPDRLELVLPADEISLRPERRIEGRPQRMVTRVRRPRTPEPRATLAAVVL